LSSFLPALFMSFHEESGSSAINPLAGDRQHQATLVQAALSRLDLLKTMQLKELPLVARHCTLPALSKL
jgi:hypothetical protein